MYKYNLEKPSFNLPKMSRQPVKLSENEMKLAIWRDEMIDYLGIDIYTLDDSYNKVSKYSRYCAEALDYLDKGQDVPDEIKEYLLKEKKKRELKKNKDA